jgi:ribose transport system substrate-binding protein
MSFMRRCAALLIGLCTLTMVISACGSSSSGPKGTSSASGGGNASSTGIVSKCDAMISQASQPLTWSAPGPPLDASQLKGKNVLFLSLSQSVPTIAAEATATQQAGKLVGINVTVFDTAGSVSSMQQGIQQAIDTHQSAIILLGIPLDVTAAALKKAHEAGIKIVSELNNEPTVGAPGQGAGPDVFGSTGPGRFTSGELLACKAVVDKAGKANAVIFGDEELTTAAPPEVAGMEAILKQCSGCKYSKNSTPTASWESQLPSKASSVVQGDPNVNYLLPLYDGMAIFMVSGVNLAGAGSRVRIASFNAVPAALSMVQKGSVLVADPGQPNAWMSWQGLDQAMRGMLGMPPGNPVVPTRFFDKQNLQGVDVNDEGGLFGTAYIAGFKKLWGVG